MTSWFDRYIRLNVGPAECVTFAPGQVRLLLPREYVARLRYTGSRVFRAKYKTMPSCQAVSIPAEKLRTHLEVARDGVAETARLAVKARIRTTWGRSHAPAVLDMLEEELKSFVPRPGYMMEAAGLTEPYVEGRSYEREHIAFERNAAARAEALRIHGYACTICGFTFSDRYATPGRIAIVHHTRPISGRGGAYQIDVKQDLVPVCANCHHVIHSRAEPFTIEEVKAMLR